MQANIRQSNFELLRLILMFIILIHHGVVMGLGLRGIAGANGWECYLQDCDIPLMFMVNGFCVVAVDVFILISGYWGIKTRSNKVLSLLFALMFYTLLFASLPYLLQGDIKHALLSAAPLSQTQYWFVREYLFLMLFAPLLNQLFESYSQKQIISFIAIMVLLCCYLGFVWQKSVNKNGYNFINFMLIYSIGRYIKQYGWQLNRYLYLLGYIILSLLIGSLSIFFVHSGHKDLAWQMTYYNNPLIICSAICLFEFFKSIEIRSTIINRLSQSALSIYLFTSSLWISRWWYSWILDKYTGNHPNWLILLDILASSIILLFIAISIDQIRLYLSKKIIRENKH